MTSSPPPDRPGPPPTSRPPRRGRARETVEVPRAVLALLGGALLVSLLLITFLVGRESGRRASQAAQVDSPSSAAGRDAGFDEDDGYDNYVDEGAEPGEPLDWTAPAEAPTPSLDPWPAAAPPEAAWPPRASTGGSSPPGPGPQSAAVAAYFTELEGYERGAKYWNNPQELAMRLVGQGTQGDTSGFRQLVETQRSAQRQIESMTVPSPCREHHRRTLEVMAKALRLLEKLERGMASGNLEGLLSLTGESRQLEADARKVDALAAEIKREYGV